MLVLVTDFGLHGPYLGQLKAVLYRDAPGVPVVDLFADAPRCNPKATAYLLAAYAREFPRGTVFVAVVDPGVGTAARRPVAVEADGRWYVGPDNGVFSLVVRRATQARCLEVLWRPERLSASFHGHDLFAPVAAQLARGQMPTHVSVDCLASSWPDDLAEIIYVDHFGNCLTGLRAGGVAATARIRAGAFELPHARTFGDVAVGTPFWYENANGLVELAVNQGDAARDLGLGIGSTVTITP